MADYVGTLPYSSELFGVYQPLLGWRSAPTQRLMEAIRDQSARALATRAMSFTPVIPVNLLSRDPAREASSGSVGHQTVEFGELHAFEFIDDARSVTPQVDSAVARLLVERLPKSPPPDWAQFATKEKINEILSTVRDLLTSADSAKKNDQVDSYVEKFLPASKVGPAAYRRSFQGMVERESLIGGLIALLAVEDPAALTHLFYRPPVPKNRLIQGAAGDPLLGFGDRAQRAVLSPIGIVHLFRQYFFEFESFLGPAVGHTWVSPGGTVELIETSSRRVLTERTLEMATETFTRNEVSAATQDDLSEAVKDENRNDVKFGFTNEANYNTPIISDTATTSYSLDSAKARTRETTHKMMRQQSEKLTSEIRKNFKTTFKTSTDFTDTSSKRYVLQNNTDELANYELRRKMRRVGVQVQDIGTKLCWSTFVDDAGRDLGISKLVHVAARADLGDVPPPEALTIPPTIVQQIDLPIPFVGLDTADLDLAFTDGEETDVGWNDDTEHIEADFAKSVAFDRPLYTLTRVDLDVQGFDALLSVRDLSSAEGSSTASFVIHLDYVDWQGLSSIPVKAALSWEPSQAVIDAANAEYLNRTAEYNTERARRFKEAFVSAARERVTAASQIRSRPPAELREEERTVVFRKLISQLMTVGGDQSEHVVSELVRSIFDVDRMLYFVAPEWWAPRRHQSGQQLGAEVAARRLRGWDSRVGATINSRIPADEYHADDGGVFAEGGDGAIGTSEATIIPPGNIVDWGGGLEQGRDNYYISEDSTPARLGSSLGWLLQLDGDDLRNAILNSPWVKAVIPIRSGHEREAMDWLRQVGVEGSDGLDAEYSAAPGDPPELVSSAQHVVTVSEALEYLIGQVQAYESNASVPIKTNPGEAADPRNHYAGSLPTEAVFEHGFYPLAGGTKFDDSGKVQSIVSQWTEILPTDQIAALSIRYDPKTLQVVHDD